MSCALLLAAVLVPDYGSLVERYRRGDETVAATLAAQRTEDVQEAVARFGRQATSLGVIPLRAAALLHTEMAFGFQAEGHDDDGHVQLALARSLIDDSRRLSTEGRRARSPTFECLWSLAVSYHFASENRLPEAILSSRESEGYCRGDAEFWLARGVLHEFLSRFSSDEGTRGRRWPFLSSFDTSPEMLSRPAKGADAHRDLARFCFERACAGNPQDAEAHLRFGRAYALASQTEEAATELSWVLNNDRSRERIYLAHLLLGDLREAQGRTAEARLRYQAARALSPDAQSASLALSHLLFSGGDHVGALQTLLPGLSPLPRGAQDPWILYNVATPMRGFENAMDDLHAAIRTPPR